MTNSVTTTSTVYSTDTVTSTVTEKGTVYVIKYSPTPVLRSTVVESVIQLTQTYTSMWLESTGSAYEETSTGSTETIGGGVGGGGCKNCPPVNTCTINGNQCPTVGGGGGWSGSKTSAAAGPSSPIQTQPAVSSKDAWTHTTAAGYGSPVGATAGPATTASGQSVGSGAEGSAVNWNAGDRLAAATRLVSIAAGLAVWAILL